MSEVKRTFPVGRTIGLILCVLAQIFLICLAVVYEPQPQDIIKKYTVTVEQLDDGSLDIEYELYWKAIDSTEPLTWVKIGMANYDYTVYEDSVSDNIRFYSKIEDDGYVALRLDFKEQYEGGESLTFSFKVNQRSMLCEEDGNYFYEFVPGWFNSTPVEEYEFRWLKSDDIIHAKGADEVGDYYVWSGEFDCGEYEKMYVEYKESAVLFAETVFHEEFDDSGAYNDLGGDKAAFVVFIVILVIVLLVVEVNIIDCYVSYYNGRGFMTSYGYHVHVHGRTNPHYIKERNRRAASSGRSGGGGGGCACACACACAGGGRAGCSQKDTYGNTANAIVKKYWK